MERILFERFTKKELQKTKETVFKIEKVIKEKMINGMSNGKVLKFVFYSKHAHNKRKSKSHQALNILSVSRSKKKLKMK